MSLFNSKPKIAIVGIGRWGKNLLREFSTIADVKLCFHHGDKENEQWLRENYPNLEIAASYDEIVKDTAIDAVIIATPVDTHYELAKQALLAGKHVFVEKPMAKRAKEAEELVSLAGERGLVLFTGYTFLNHPVFEKIKEIFKDKKLRSVEFTWNKYGTFNEDIVWNLLSHDMAIAISLFGEPTNVSVLDKKGIISEADIIHVRAEFDENKHCTFQINRAADNKEKVVKLFVEDFTYLWRSDSLYILNNEKPKPKLIYQSDVQPLAVECEEFMTQIKNPENGTRGIIGLQVTKALESIAGD